MTERGRLVAIVDDEAEVGKALTRLLRSAGFEAEAFASGPAFLAWARSGAPEFALLDIQMPEMSGFEVQRLLVRDHRTVRCVFITALAEPEYERRASEAGAELLRKPFSDDQLFAALDRAARG